MVECRSPGALESRQFNVDKETFFLSNSLLSWVGKLAYSPFRSASNSISRMCQSILNKLNVSNGLPSKGFSTN